MPTRNTSMYELPDDDSPRFETYSEVQCHLSIVLDRRILLLFYVNIVTQGKTQISFTLKQVWDTEY